MSIRSQGTCSGSPARLGAGCDKLGQIPGIRAVVDGIQKPVRRDHGENPFPRNSLNVAPIEKLAVIICVQVGPITPNYRRAIPGAQRLGRFLDRLGGHDDGPDVDSVLREMVTSLECAPQTCAQQIQARLTSTAPRVSCLLPLFNLSETPACAAHRELNGLGKGSRVGPAPDRSAANLESLCDGCIRQVNCIVHGIASFVYWKHCERFCMDRRG